MSILLIFSHYCVYLICMFGQSSIGLHAEVKEQFSRRQSSPSAVGSGFELTLSGLRSKLLYTLSAASHWSREYFTQGRNDENHFNCCDMVSLIICKESIFQEYKKHCAILRLRKNSNITVLQATETAVTVQLQ